MEREQLLMPNLRPKVRIVQDFAAPAITARIPELPPVIVGPAYHVVDDPDTTQSEIDNYSKGDELVISQPPANITGALLDPDSVNIHLDDVYVVIPSATGTNGEIAAHPANNAITIPSLDLTELGIEVGDQIYLAHGGWTSPHVSTVTSIIFDSPDTIIGFDNPAPEVGSTPDTSVSFFINRHVGSVTLDSDHDDITVDGQTVTLANEITITVADFSDPVLIFSATVAMTYRALRQDLNELLTIEAINEIEGLIGKITPDNPLALGAFLALQNTSTSIKVYGITGDNVGDATDREEAYGMALDYLENREDVYYLTPLANEQSIITSFLAHCIAMSDPDKSRFRITLGSGFLPDIRITAPVSNGTTEDSTDPHVLTVTTGGGFFDSTMEGSSITITGLSVTPTTTTITRVFSADTIFMEDLDPTITKGSTASVTIAITPPGESAPTTTETSLTVTIRGVLDELEDTTGNFANVSVGQYVAIPTGPYGDFSAGYETYQIVERYHSNRVRIDPLGNYGELPASTDETTGTTTDYRVQTPLDKQGQAEDLAAYASAFGNSRLTLVWPGDVKLAGQGGAFHEGYYLASALAGQCANYPSHQNMTGLPLAGVEELRYSSEYFTDSQIDMIMDGGWNVYTQATPLAAPSSLRALTTDTSFLESMELMIVKNFDFVSLFYRDLLRPFLKGYNIFPGTLDQIRDAFSAGSAKLKARQYQRIGSTIIDANLVSIALMEGTSDHLLMVATINLPRPLNTITLMLTA